MSIIGRHSNGSILEVSIVAVLIVGVLGLLGFVFWQNFINKQPGQERDSLQVTTAQQSSLNAIEQKLLALPHRSDMIASVNNSNSYDVVFPGPDDTTISVSAKITVIYNASHYATGSNSNVVGSNDSAVKERAANEAIDLVAVSDVMREAGLTLTEARIEGGSAGLPYTDLYESDLLVCNVSDSLGVAPVTCAPRATYNLARASVSEVMDLAQAKFPNSSLAGGKGFVHQSFTEASDGTTGVVLQFSGGDKIDAFYAKPMGGSWEYLASSSHGEGAIQAPGCSEIARAPYGNIFGIKGC